MNNSECTQGYTAETQARGLIPGLSYDAECPAGLAKTLCCAPSTTIGVCKWDGWRGVGMPCTGTCANTKAKSIAENTNSYRNDEGVPFIDHTCNRGTQQYCCEGFKPPAHSNLADLVLLGRDPRSPTSLTRRELEKRKVPLRAMRDAQCHQVEGTRAVLAALRGVTGVDLLNDGGLSAEIDLQIDACEKQASSTSASEESTPGSETGSSDTSLSDSSGSVDLGDPPVDLVDNPTPEGFDGISTGQTIQAGQTDRLMRSGAAGAAGLKPAGIVKLQSTTKKKPPKSKPKNGQKVHGGYAYHDYEAEQPSDCTLTYSCQYGIGFDEVSDLVGRGVFYFTDKVSGV
jgi:hypothetical protein